jgi:putative salt-induced outer membrane protein YdiY
MLHRSSFRTATIVTAGLCTGGAASTLLAQDAAKPAEEKKPLWETTANVGIALTRGNSENFLATAGINTQRKWSRDEVFMGAAAAYGTTTVEETNPTPPPATREVDNRTESYAKGFVQYNHLFTPRFYVGIRGDALNDEIADVHYRFTLSPLAGYYFIKNPQTTFSGEAGPSWIVEKVGDSGARGYLGVRAGERFEHKFKNGARVWEAADITPEVENWENYVVNAEIGVEAPITKKLLARAVLQDTYDHQPAPGREKNDLKLIAGLAYKF